MRLIFLIIVFTLISIGMTFACEKPITFKIKGVKTGSIYTVLGLKNGDVIKEINGKTLCRQQDVQSRMKIGIKSKKLNFLISRNGQDLPLNFTF
jgi:type II secretory pathway component PulC